MKYIQINEQMGLPILEGLDPFKCVVIVDEDVAEEWQESVSQWLVDSGCRYMMAWGKNCSSWDDSVDMVNMEQFNFGEIPEESFVMTTWHEKETLNEVFWFAKNTAHHEHHDLKNILLIHISNRGRENEILEECKNA